MESINYLFKKNGYPQLALLILLIIYILSNLQTPAFLSVVLDNIYGNLAVIVVAFYLLTKLNPIVGVVLIFAAYELIKRSSEQTGTAALQKYLPTEFKKNKHFTAFNQFPITLEEEVVSKMAPSESGPMMSPEYKPSSGDTYNAMNVQDTISVI